MEPRQDLIGQYQYASCRNEMSEVTLRSEEPAPCPRCGSKSLKRLLAFVAGSDLGWYEPKSYFSTYAVWLEFRSGHKAYLYECNGRQDANNFAFSNGEEDPGELIDDQLLPYGPLANLVAHKALLDQLREVHPKFEAARSEWQRRRLKDLSSSIESLQQKAAEALGWAKVAEAIEPLRALLATSQSDNVRKAVQGALERIEQP